MKINRLETVEEYRVGEQRRRSDRLAEIVGGRSVEELYDRIARANRRARLRFEAICAARAGVGYHEPITPEAERAKKARNLLGERRFRDAQAAKRGFVRIPTDLDYEIALEIARGDVSLDDR